ncbi:hypothetical protein GCM10022217_30300 [Chryseobacterium ginsenosidimutans]|uniref:hypothetical protein n=1 Tax=Chryseobacterium ginsenosidimutans TaxID=687846 RepID=UPI0031D9086D
MQTEQDYSLKSKQYTIQQLLRSQLEKKDPQLVSKVDRLQGKKASGNARIYTDAENGFSVDTEKAIYVEDTNGNKTYTFKIERNGTGSGFLENLILKQIAASEYSAYIVKYDQTAVENLGSIAQNDLKNHITFTSLGTKTGAEVFGKYNADPCQVMMPVSSNWVLVGGTMCYTGDHDYAHIGDCNYATNNGYPPTPGYYTYEISYGAVDICGGGGGFTPGNSSGGGTTPIGGGGSGGGTGTYIDPCTKLKNVLSKKFVDPPNTTVNDALGVLENHLPVNNPQNDGTQELLLFANTIANSNDVEFSSMQTSGTHGEVDGNVNPALKYIFLGHDHPGENDLSIFSLSDLYTIKNLINKGVVDSTTVFYVTTHLGTKYAFTISNIESFKTWANQFFMGWEGQLDPGVGNPMIIARENDYENDVKKGNTNVDNEKGFLKFIERKLLSLQMFTLENNQWKKMTYSSLNDQIIKINCN